MRFFAPKSFKDGDYYFNKYDKTDLFILAISITVGIIICITGLLSIVSLSTITLAIVLVSIGAIIIAVGLLLTMPVEIHHNLLGKIKCVILFRNRQKIYKWNGYNYNNYQNDDEVERG